MGDEAKGTEVRSDQRGPVDHGKRMVFILRVWWFSPKTSSKAIGASRFLVA